MGRALTTDEGKARERATLRARELEAPEHREARNLEENGWDEGSIEAMRAWCQDCEWANVDAEQLETVPAALIRQAVARYYGGGVAQFLEDAVPVQVQR